MLVPCLFLALQGDSRMDVRATLDAPRATYAEFGAWVQKSTGVPVVVASPIRERKLTVLVEDRPVRETMERVAETLFLQWERTDEGYTLRLDPNVAGEERSALAELAEARTQVLRESLEDLARFATGTSTSLTAARESAEASAKAPGRKVATVDRVARLSQIATDPAFSAIGGILAAMGPSGRANLVAGGRLFASNRPGPGMIGIPSASLAELGGSSSGNLVLAMLTGDPETGTVRATVGTFGASAGGRTVEIKEGERQTVDQARFASALYKRLAVWASKFENKKLDAKAKLSPTAAGGPSRRTLADLLVDLHARSGMPIVADGFREAAWDKVAPMGENLWAWWEAQAELVRSAGVPSRSFVPRTSEGWLEVRRQYYWEQLTREIPEGPIRRLESAVRDHGATLDDVAALAASLTPAQAKGIDVDPPAMQAPVEAFGFSVVPILRVWNALPPHLRRAAMSNKGLAIGPGAAARRELLDALAQRCAESANADLLALLLPGASLAVPTLYVGTAEGGPGEGDPAPATYEMTVRASGKDLAYYSVRLGVSRRRQ